MNRLGLAYVQDLFLLMVATVAVSMLMVNLSSLLLEQQERDRQFQLDAEADRLCDAVRSFADLLHEEQRGILDRTALDESSEESLRSGLKIDGGFILTIATATSGNTELQERWVWSTGVPPKEKGTCVSSCAIWFDEGDVRPARVTVWTWRV